MKKLVKNQHMRDRLHLLAAILARWRHPVASIKAVDLLHRAMCAVLYRRTAMAIKMASKVGPFFHPCIVCCCPGGCWGDREQVVAQWQHPVASGVALDMPHWVMPSVSLQRARMVIKMACNGGAFVYFHPFFCLPLS
jgi:hypothetical protein